MPSNAHINSQRSQCASFTCNRIGCCVYTRLHIAAHPLHLGEGLYACWPLVVQGGMNSLLLGAFTIYLKHLAPYVQQVLSQAMECAILCVFVFAYAFSFAIQAWEAPLDGSWVVCETLVAKFFIQVTKLLALSRASFPIKGSQVLPQWPSFSQTPSTRCIWSECEREEWSQNISVGQNRGIHKLLLNSWALLLNIGSWYLPPPLDNQRWGWWRRVLSPTPCAHVCGH